VPGSAGEHPLAPFRLLPRRQTPSTRCALVVRGFHLKFPPGGPVVSEAFDGADWPRVGDRLAFTGGRDVRGLGGSGLCQVQATLPPLIQFEFIGPDGARRSTQVERPPG
jgi:hypothetical protein